MNCRWFFASLAFIVACSYAYISPPATGSANISVVLSGEVNGQYTMFIPASDSVQQVEDFNRVQYFLDDYGNRKTTVDGTYRLEFLVRVNANNQSINADAPFPFEIGGFEDYLQPTLQITSTNAEVISQAKEITHNTRTTVEAIVALASWVHENIVYDPKYSASSLSGIETLRTGKGVCDEYTSLYASLARAVGIPTRVVVGLVFTGTGWLTHAWAESYIPGNGWVGVDPTYQEVGLIDAGHIKLYTAPKFLKEAYSFGDPPKRNDPQATFLSKDEFDLPLKLDGAFSEFGLFMGQPFNFTLRVKNDGGNILTPTYTLQRMEGITIRGSPSKTAMVPPRQEVSLSWELLSPLIAEQNETQIFERALVVYGPRASDLNYPLILNPRGKAYNFSRVELTSVASDIGEDEVTIFIGIKNIGNMPYDAIGVTVGALGTSSKTRYVRLNAGEERMVSFKFEKPSETTDFMVTVKAGEEELQDHLVIKSNLATDVMFKLKRLTDAVQDIWYLSIPLILIVLAFLFLKFVYPEIRIVITLSGSEAKEHEWEQLLGKRIKK